MDLEIRGQRYDTATQCICVAGQFGLFAHHRIKIATCKALGFLHIHSIFCHENGGNLISTLKIIERSRGCRSDNLYCHSFFNENAIAVALHLICKFPDGHNLLYLTVCCGAKVVP